MGSTCTSRLCSQNSTAVKQTNLSSTKTTATISEAKGTTMEKQSATATTTKPKLTIGKMTIEEWEVFQETLKAYQTSPTPGNWGGLVHLKLDTEWNKDSFRMLKEWAYSQIESYVNLHQKEGTNLEEGTAAADGDNNIIKIIPHFSLDDDDDDDDDSSISSSDEQTDETKTSDPPKQKIGLIGMHISLSKPFFLQHQNIDSFIENLTKRFEKCFDPFNVMFEPNAFQQPTQNDKDDTNTASSSPATTPSCQIQVLVNPRGTRSFLTLPMNSNSAEGIKKLINATDDVMKEYNMPTFYPEPKIHVSIASASCNLNELYGENSDTAPAAAAATANTDTSAEMKEEDTSTATKAISAPPQKADPIMFHVKSVQCDFGKSDKKFTIPFRGASGTV